MLTQFQSPHWLLVQGRTEDANAALRKLRQGAFTEAEIEKEFASIQLSLEMEPEQGHFKELFQGVNRKRTAVVVMMNFFLQATGQAFASQYGTLYVKSLNSINPFHFNVITGFLGLSMVIFSLLTNDKIGRR